MSRTRILLPLTVREQNEILALTNHPGYPVLVKIMSSACNSLAAEVINSDSIDPIKILSLQQLAKAAKEFYDRVSYTVDGIINDIVNGDTPETDAGEE